MDSLRIGFTMSFCKKNFIFNVIFYFLFLKISLEMFNFNLLRCSFTTNNLLSLQLQVKVEHLKSSCYCIFESFAIYYPLKEQN